MNRLWYAAFGSNLSKEWFSKYLMGGHPPLSDAETIEPGARDPRPALADVPFATDHELYFADESRRGAGQGVAFLDPNMADVVAGPTLCRAYNITIEQFEDLHRQENGAVETARFDLERFLSEGQAVQYEGRYGLALLLGFLDDRLPVVTITCPLRLTPPRPPQPHYLQTVAVGLSESMGMSPDQVVDYLLRKEGIRGSLGAAAVSAAVTGIPMP